MYVFVGLVGFLSILSNQRLDTEAGIFELVDRPPQAQQGPDQRERERWLTGFKEERDCSSKCVIYLGGVITRTNQIVCL